MRSRVKKVLVTIDDSDGSWKALDYVGKQCEGVNDLEITLFHVLVGLPPQLWDDRHLLTEADSTIGLKIRKDHLENTCQDR